MNTIDFNGMASKYGLDAAFVQSLHEKIVDKENFARAVKMFADGTLPFDVATGDAPINVASIRHDVAVNMWNARKIRAERVKEQMEMQRRIVEYYNGCKRMTMAHAKDNRIRSGVERRPRIRSPNRCTSTPPASMLLREAMCLP